jgi:DNA modification methylase
MTANPEPTTQRPSRARAPRTLTPVVHTGDAQSVASRLPSKSVDVVVTSPPYWRKRDYGHPDQLGWEKTPRDFARRLVNVMESWRPVLKPHASVFINLGDSVRDGRMAGVTTLFEVEAIERGWGLVSRIMWAKRSGLPDPHARLPQRHEVIFQFVTGRSAPYMDTYAYGQEFELSEGTVWHVKPGRSLSAHLAPFPEELPRRAILLACPEQVCIGCGRPRQRLIKRGLKLNPARAQSARALERWHASGLGERHLEAIRATGICDAGKSLRFQVGAHGNSAQVTALAKEAKVALGGYFREFTFALPEHTGWAPCEQCGEAKHRPGLVLDPFVGTGTTLRAAQALGRRSVGLDLTPMCTDLD